MWQGSDTHLKSQPRDAAQPFVHMQNLFDDRFRIADQERAGRSKLTVEMGSSHRWPASFFSDRGKAFGITGEEIGGGHSKIFGHIAQGMDADFQLFQGMPGADTGLAIKIDQWLKPAVFPAD